MDILAVVERWRGFAGRPAVVCDDVVSTYAQLTDAVDAWRRELSDRGVRIGDCVAVSGSPSLKMIALVVALIERACVIVPFISDGVVDRDYALQTACVDRLVEFEADGSCRFVRCGFGTPHPLLQQLRSVPEAGLILFTSGSTGRNKASVHRFSALIANVMRREGRALTTLVFLMFDHIGGMNTLLHTLCQGGTAVFITDRSVDAVCKAIARYRVELLPTTPTFLNMVLLSGRYRDYDFSSLRMITYGTEPMSVPTLKGLAQALPDVRYKQTYGLTEAGILPTLSQGPDSTWMKLGGHGYETKVVDDTLWIRSGASMLGYLNAPSPFCPDGWLNTGDHVELRDGFIRILGRKSEVINVGGEKVYPAEVEDVLMQVSNVCDVVVAGRASAVTGQLVVATVKLVEPEDPAAVERRAIQHCREHLASYKVPVMIRVVTEDLHGARFKKLRSARPASPTPSVARPMAEEA